MPRTEGFSEMFQEILKHKKSRINSDLLYED